MLSGIDALVLVLVGIGAALAMRSLRRGREKSGCAGCSGCCRRCDKETQKQREAE